MSDFEKGIQSELQNSELHLRQDVCEELQTMRRAALSTPDPWWRLRRIVWPTTGMALASLIAVVLIQNTDPARNSEQPAVKEKYSDNFDLYENLDFYYWLANGENDIRG